MSIIITNVSKNFDKKGLQTYRLSINDKYICTFNHVRELGLANCLRMAAHAVETGEVPTRRTMTYNGQNAKEILSFVAPCCSISSEFGGIIKLLLTNGTIVVMKMGDIIDSDGVKISKEDMLP